MQMAIIALLVGVPNLLLRQEQKFSSQVGPGCLGLGLLPRLLWRDEVEKLKKKRRFQTWLGFEGSAPSHQAQQIPALQQPNLGNLIVQKGNQMLGEKMT